jgi:hypothetical protein
MSCHNYHSVDHYKKVFADVICEVSDDDCSDETITNMLAGFEQSIIDLMGYHDAALKRLRKLHGAFMRGETESLLD